MQWGVILMSKVVGKPQGRTQVKGNIFSFNMPWADIEDACRIACESAQRSENIKVNALREELGVPHTEETLATLVNIHIVGGSTDLSQHLSGLTMRVSIVRRLIELLRQRISRVRRRRNQLQHASRESSDRTIHKHLRNSIVYT